MGTIPILVRSRVLYSALHAGDAIAVSDLDQLEDELLLISTEAGERASSSLKTFIQDMTELICTARYEQNPIAF